MLAENGVELEMTDAALNFLSQVGYDPEFGARPVKRAIQRYLLNDLSKKLLAQEVDRSKSDHCRLWRRRISIQKLNTKQYCQKAKAGMFPRKHHSFYIPEPILSSELQTDSSDDSSLKHKYLF